MRVLSPGESRLLTRQFSRFLKTGLVLAGSVISLLTVLSIGLDRRESEAAARQNDLNINVAVHVQAELIFDQSYFSLKGIATDLRGIHHAAIPVEALRSAMRYDPVSRYLFAKWGDVTMVVDNERRVSTEVNELIGKIPLVNTGMTPVILAPLFDPASSQFYIPLLISTDAGSGQSATLGALIPLSKFTEYVLGAGQRVTSGEGLFLLDGTVIMRTAGRSAVLGQRTAAGLALAKLAANRSSGDFTVPGLAGQAVTGSFSRSQRYPFIAASAQNEDQYLAPWRNRSYAKGIALLLAFVVIGWGAATMFKVMEALSSSEKLLRRLFDDVAEAIVVFRPDGTVVSVNPGAMAILGAQRAEELIGRNMASLLPGSFASPQTRMRVERALQGEHQAFEYSTQVLGSEHRFDFAVNLNAFEMNGVAYLISVTRDVTQERRQARQQEFLASHDPLTGLPNRHSLLRALDRHIEEQPKTPIYLMLVNLARFREINESFGPRVGDTVLEMSAQRLSTALAQRDWTLTRLGGTDFVAYAMGERVDQLEVVRKLVFEVLSEPVQISAAQVQFHARLGITCYPADALDASQLLRCAELAVSLAKSRTNHWACYDREYDLTPGHDLKIRTDLATAIREQQLSLYYQPKVRLKDGRLAGAEALLRWRHPTEGWIPPVEFIPLAESTELIHALTRWVLGEALDQIQRWQQAGTPVALAVNISVNNLQDPDFNTHVIDLLVRKGVDPALLDLEVTEGALANNPEIVLRRLHELRDMGIGLSLDDFGTGFSGLSYVSQFPFSSIKIDRSFVSSLIGSERDRKVAQSAISLGHDLQLKTIAEGVEDEATVKELLALHCDIGQGYLFGKPMPVDEFDRWLVTHAARMELIAQ